MSFRVGQGYDVHAFEATAPGSVCIRLGGIEIPHTHKVLAHSDGDVLLHAICDACLGALALGDIGQHFPDTDADWAGADSADLFQHVLRLVEKKGYRLSNLDGTVIAERPKLSPHVADIRKRIASLAGCDMERISIKATTSEKLGFVGRQEGIACMAVVLLESV